MNKLDELIKEGKGFKFAQDCNDKEILIVIRYIIDTNINDKDKRNLIQQFLLNWLSINTINISVESIKY